MLSIDLSDASKLKADVRLLDKPPAIIVTQSRPTGSGAPQSSSISIPLADLKKLAESVSAIVKIFRG